MVSSFVIFEGTMQFQNNFTRYGGAVLSKISNFTFAKSACARDKWDVEFCHHSRMFPQFEPEPGSSFINITALRGGAMHLDQRSSIYIHPLTCMLFKNNMATQYGGAIYVVVPCLHTKIGPILFSSTGICGFSSVPLHFAPSCGSVALD